MSSIGLAFLLDASSFFLSTFCDVVSACKCCMRSVWLQGLFDVTLIHVDSLEAIIHFRV